MPLSPIKPDLAATYGTRPSLRSLPIAV